MDLKKLNVLELSAKEVGKIEGGGLGPFRFTLRFLDPLGASRMMGGYEREVA